MLKFKMTFQGRKHYFHVHFAYKNIKTNMIVAEPHIRVAANDKREALMKAKQMVGNFDTKTPYEGLIIVWGKIEIVDTDPEYKSG